MTETVTVPVQLPGTGIVLEMHVRPGSPSDEAVLKEVWTEDVYQVNDRNLLGKTVLDVGANIGSFTVYSALRGARVHALEPDPENMKILVANLDAAISDFPNLTKEQYATWPVAVTSYNGRAKLSGEHGGCALRDIGEPGPDSDREVTVLTLEEAMHRFGLDHIDVLKMDIEGSEYPALITASEETLARIDYITLEFHATSNEIFGALVANLATTFNLHIIGRPDRGGYIYGDRY